MPEISSHYTAFPKTENNLRFLIKEIDTESFLQKRFSACSLSFQDCLGRCCSLKVAVTAEEIDVLKQLCREKENFLKDNQIDPPSQVFAYDARTGRKCLAKRKRGFRELHQLVLSLLPKIHRIFSKKKILDKLLRVCVFLRPDGLCVLELIAREEGKHRWYYKPINCWKYPLSIRKGRLTFPVLNENPHFPCHAHRDKSCALDGLEEELAFLGNIVGRDLIKEIRDSRKTASL